MKALLKLIVGAVGTFLVATAILAFTQPKTEFQVGAVIAVVGAALLGFAMYEPKKQPGRTPVPPASARR